MGAFSLMLKDETDCSCSECIKNANIANDMKGIVGKRFRNRDDPALEYTRLCDKVLTKKISFGEKKPKVKCEHCIDTGVERRQCETIVEITNKAYPKDKAFQGVPVYDLEQYEDWTPPQRPALPNPSDRSSEPSSDLPVPPSTEQPALQDPLDEALTPAVVPEHTVQPSQDGLADFETSTSSIAASEAAEVLGEDYDEEEVAATEDATPSESGQTNSNSDEQTNAGQSVQGSGSTIEPRYFSQMGKTAFAADHDCKTCQKDSDFIRLTKNSITKLLRNHDPNLDENYLSQCEQMLKKNVLNEDECENCCTIRNEKRHATLLLRYTKTCFHKDKTYSAFPMANLETYTDLQDGLIEGPFHQLAEAYQSVTHLENGINWLQSEYEALESENETLLSEGTLAEAYQSITRLETDIETLRSDNTSLSDQLKALRSANESLRKELADEREKQKQVGTMQDASTMVDAWTVADTEPIPEVGTTKDAGTMANVSTMGVAAKHGFSAKKGFMFMLALLAVFSPLAVIFSLRLPSQPPQQPEQVEQPITSDLTSNSWYQPENQSLHTIETETFWLDGRIFAELAQAAGLPIYAPYGRSGYYGSDSFEDSPPNLLYKTFDLALGRTVKLAGLSASCLTAAIIHYRPSLSARGR